MCLQITGLARVWPPDTCACHACLQGWGIPCRLQPKCALRSRRQPAARVGLGLRSRMCNTCRDSCAAAAWAPNRFIQLLTAANYPHASNPGLRYPILLPAASAGIGPNLLLARIASEEAKPNGQMQVTQAQAGQYLQVTIWLTGRSDGAARRGIALHAITGARVTLPAVLCPGSGKSCGSPLPAVPRCVQGLAVDKLPGVGWVTRHRLEVRGITSVADVQARTKPFLQAELGDKQGAMLWDFAHGRDNRQVLCRAKLLSCLGVIFFEPMLPSCYPVNKTAPASTSASPGWLSFPPARLQAG